MKLRKTAVTLALLALGSGSAFALPHVETGDAGQSLVTSQALGAGTSSITGSLDSDADMYRFDWGGGAFYVNTQGSDFDTQLFLFNSSGAGVWGNDDGLVELGSYIEDAALASGTYYLAISGFDLDPYSAYGLMFQNAPTLPQYAPLNPGAPLTGWAAELFESGAYQINFRSATGETVETGHVPEPGTLALLGLGLIGMFAGKRRKL